MLCICYDARLTLTGAFALRHLFHCVVLLLQAFYQNYISGMCRRPMLKEQPNTNCSFVLNSLAYLIPNDIPICHNHINQRIPSSASRPAVWPLAVVALRSKHNAPSAEESTGILKTPTQTSERTSKQLRMWPVRIRP